MSYYFTIKHLIVTIDFSDEEKNITNKLRVKSIKWIIKGKLFIGLYLKSIIIIFIIEVKLSY